VRAVYVALFLAFTPVMAQGVQTSDFMRLYSLVRQTLCTLKITCALPADLLLPVGYNNYAPEVAKAQQILLMVPPERVTQVYALLASRYQGDQKGWPSLKILVDQSRRKDLAGWERKELQGYVTVVSGSSDGDDALSALIGSGLWLAYFQGNGVDKLYLVFGNDLWLEPQGPLANQIKPLVLMAIDLIEATSKREKEVK
jgi:hypothetical protein